MSEATGGPEFPFATYPKEEIGRGVEFRVLRQKPKLALLRFNMERFINQLRKMHNPNQH